MTERKVTTEEVERITTDLGTTAARLRKWVQWEAEAILCEEAADALRSLAAERDAMREALRENGRLGCNTCLEVLDALGENQPTEDAPPPIPPRPYEPDRMP